MMSVVDFVKNTLVIVTGASQGIGQTVCLEIAKRSTAATFILIARSQNGLNETKALILNENKSFSVEVHPLDLSKPSSADYQQIVDSILKTNKKYDQTIVVHNAGQVGDLKKATDLDDLNVWQSYYNLNFFSVTLMNSVFVKKLTAVSEKLFLVNITSLCGRVPFANLAMYGSGKAARELYFKVLALEEPSVMVLNYSPGPVDTDMFNGIIANAQDTELRKTFTEMRTTNQVLTTVQTVTKLLTILEKGDFKSGDTIDYFDRV